MLIRIFQSLSNYAPAFLWLLTLWVFLGRYVVISINVSDSLPGRVYLIQKGVMPELDDFAAFHYQGGGPYPAGSRFLKLVKGVTGAKVRSVESESGFFDFYVNGSFVGRAKPRSRTGSPLTPGPTGIIPPQHYYMAAPNPDSLDSRYALVGWVDEGQVIGRAIEVF
jgi:conjugal transfer pilin signal peptidase TrbI